MSLNETFQVRQFAFEWGGTIRVWKNATLKVFEVDDKAVFKYANGTYGESIQGIWLEFEVQSPFLQLVSPATLSGNDFNDLRSALNDPTTTVTFYPIYDVDASVSYEVIKSEGRTPLLQTRRSMFAPQMTIALKARNRINTGAIPTWLNYTKQS